MNSGIRHDALILAQVRKLQDKTAYNDSIMLTKQLTERLTEGSGDKGGSVPRRSNFCNMVCQRTLRPQLDIYEAHLEQLGRTLPERYQGAKKVEDEEARGIKFIGSAFADEVKEDNPPRDELMSPLKK